MTILKGGHLEFPNHDAISTGKIYPYGRLVILKIYNFGEKKKSIFKHDQIFQYTVW